MLNIDFFIQKKLDEDKKRLEFEDALNGYRIDIAQKLSEKDIEEMSFYKIPSAWKVTVAVSDKFKQCKGVFSKDDCKKIIRVTIGFGGKVTTPSEEVEFSILKYLLSESEQSNK